MRFPEFAGAPGRTALLEGGVPRAAGRIMEAQRERLLAQMKELQVSLERIERKVAHYERLADGEPDEWDHAYMQGLIEKRRKVVQDG